VPTMVGTKGGAMESVGIHELKEQISEILRRVREDGEGYEVTYHGRAVARLVPVVEPKQSPSACGFWERWGRLSERVSARWPEGTSAVEAVREGRRDP
jgi:prevent-host-death family protein